MLYRPIRSRRIIKWAYALIEYDLTFEPLRTLKGQVLSDFIVEHGIDLDDKINYHTFIPWKLYFDESVCKDGQGMSSRLDFYCTGSLIRVDYVAFHGGKTC